MDKRERLEKAITGDALDRVPVCLWRHWQGDNQRVADLAQSLAQFQFLYDWDLMVVAPSSHFCLTGYGLQDEWQGNLMGENTLKHSPIKRSLDWTELRPQDPLRGDLAKQSECLRLIGEQFDTPNVPYIQLVYSPLSQAIRLAGYDTFIRHLRTQPDRLQSGLNTLTETTLRWLETLKKTNIVGLYYVIECADYALLSEAEFLAYGLPYDQKVLATLPTKWWLNVLSVTGQHPMLKSVMGLPHQLINWQTSDGNPTLEKSKGVIRSAVMGGLGKWEHLQNGTPLSIRDAVRQIFNVTNGRNVVLSCDGAFPISAPRSNIQAIREMVKMAVI
jgi:uroporphyrinogen decarboxylase